MSHGKVQALLAVLIACQVLWFWWYYTRHTILDDKIRFILSPPQPSSQTHGNTRGEPNGAKTNDATSREKKKGHLWIHMGPPKTATSTLQVGLGSLESFLRKDSYAYVGKFLVDGTEDKERNAFKREILSASCHKRLSKLRQKYSNTTNETLNDLPALYQSLTRVDCWKKVLDKLATLRHEGISNIILSDELLGLPSAWRRWPGMDQWSPLDWISLRLTLERHYHIHIVVTYRRYYEWMVSAKVHQCRYKANKPSLNAWGKSLRPILDPTTSRGNPFVFTDEIVHRVGPYFPNSTHVMNMHEPNDGRSNATSPTINSIRTNFVCNILHNAPETCQTSRQWDKESAEVRANAGQDTTVMEAFYDILVTTAAERGLFETKGLYRRNVALKAREYHLHEQQTKKQRLELPLQCPSPSQTQSIWQETQQREKASLSLNPAETNRTKIAFGEYLEQRKLCLIDAPQALEQDLWKTFFASLKQKS